jgi:hypothetical protein
LDSAFGQEKQIQIQNKETKLSVFMDDIYVENPMDYTKVLLAHISVLSKLSQVSGYKINE